MSALSNCTAGWCSSEPWCAIACAADVLGRKWHPIIVFRLLEEGPAGFADLESSVDGLSDTVLSGSPTDLEERGIVERRVVSDRPFRVEYALTERGGALEPVLDTIGGVGSGAVREGRLSGRSGYPS